MRSKSHQFERLRAEWMRNETAGVFFVIHARLAVGRLSRPPSPASHRRRSSPTPVSSSSQPLLILFRCSAKRVVCNVFVGCVAKRELVLVVHHTVVSFVAICVSRLFFSFGTPPRRSEQQHFAAIAPPHTREGGVYLFIFPRSRFIFIVARLARRRPE